MIDFIIKYEKSLSLKIPLKAKTILQKYEKNKRDNEDYVFPFIQHANPQESEDIYRKVKVQLNYYSESAVQIPAEMIQYGVSKIALIGLSRGLAELVRAIGSF